MKRESNYDLLKIISAVAVIMIHVSGTWFLDAIGRVAEYGVDACEIQAAFMICLYNSISRFAVPCFIMLSGAFISGMMIMSLWKGETQTALVKENLAG